MNKEQVLHSAKTKIPKHLGILSHAFITGFTKNKSINNKTTFKDLVTKTDKEIEKRFAEWLKVNFPGHSLIGEETFDSNLKGNDWHWCIDPIDGTTNFIHGIPECAIIISLMYKKEPLMSWIMFPLLEKLFFAEKGKGIYLNNKKISLLKHEKLENSLLTTLDLDKFDEFQQTLASLWEKVSGVRIGGCTASAYCALVLGQVQIGVLPNSYLWEYSAGGLLVKEAGGEISTLKSSKVTYETIKEDIVIACSKKLLSATLYYIKKVI